MRTTALATLFICCSFLASAQLVKTNQLDLQHAKALKKIPIGVTLGYTISRPGDSASGLKKINYFGYGKITAISSDTLIMDLHHNGIEKFYINGGMTQFVQIKYDSAMNTKNAIMNRNFRIPFSDLSSISYQREFRNIAQVLSSELLIASLVSLIIVSPLVSINFHEHTFNLNRYESWVLASAVGLTVSIPILSISGNKKITFRSGK